jgi:hypothetical protein
MRCTFGVDDALLGNKARILPQMSRVHDTISPSLKRQKCRRARPSAQNKANGVDKENKSPIIDMMKTIKKTSPAPPQ